MNDMTDPNRREDEYEYEYSDTGWVRRLKGTTDTSAPLPEPEPGIVTVGLTETMTAGHTDTSTAVPTAADDTCLSQLQATPLSDRGASCDSDLTTEHGETSAGPRVVVDTGVDAPNATVETRNNRGTNNCPSKTSSVLGTLMDCVITPAHCFVDSRSTSLETCAVSSSGLQTNTNLRAQNEKSKLVVDEQKDTEEDERHICIKPNYLALSQATTNLLAKEFQFECSDLFRPVPEVEPWTEVVTCDAFKPEEGRHQTHLETHSKNPISGKQETVEGDLGTRVKCDSFAVSQATTDVVVEEPQIEHSSDVKEELKAVSEADEWTQLNTSDSRSSGVDSKKHIDIETKQTDKPYSDQRHVGNQAPKESHGIQEGSTHGYQEVDIEGTSVAGGSGSDTHNVLNPLQGSQTEAQGVSLECEAEVAQQVLGYSGTHVLVQSEENFTMNAGEISAEHEMAPNEILIPAPSVPCSADSLATALGVSAANSDQATNKDINAEDSNVEVTSCTTVNLTPETDTSELVVDTEHLTDVCNLMEKQEDPVKGDLEKSVDSDSLVVTSEDTTDVVGEEEVQFLPIPDVREEVRVVSEIEGWTQLEISDSCSEKPQEAQTCHVAQSSDNLAPEETHGLYQEGYTEGMSVTKCDRNQVLKTIQGSSTEDQEISLESEQKSLEYCETHFSVQTDENFSKNEAEQSSSLVETAKDTLDSTISIGRNADNTGAASNIHLSLLSDSDKTSLETVSCDAMTLTPDTTSELLVQHLTNDQGEIEASDAEKFVKCDSVLLSQVMADVVIEEPQFQTSPDVREEVAVTSQDETRMALETCQVISEVRNLEICHSGSTEEEGQLRYFETHYSDQPLMNVTDKQQVDTTEGDIGGIDSHPLTYNVQNSITQSLSALSLSESGNWYQSQATGTQNQAPVAPGDLTDASVGEEDEGEGVSVKRADYDSSSNESWLDACQFLAGEENDEWGHSPVVSSCDESTNVYTTRSTKGLSEQGGPGETESEPEPGSSHSALWMPPIERWSSSDSWVSALSDWAPALPTHPEDPNGCESGIEASGMAIQKGQQAVEVEASPGGSSQKGQAVTTLPQNLLALGVHQSAETGVGGAEVDGDSRGPTTSHTVVACSCLPTPAEKTAALSGDMGAACDTLSAGEPFVHQPDCPRNLLYGDSYRIQTDLYRKIQASLQQPSKDGGQQHFQPGSTLWGATEGGVSLPVLSSEEKGERTYGTLNISDYLSRAALGGEGHGAYAPFLATDSETGHLTCSLDQADSSRRGVSSSELSAGSLRRLQGEKRGFPHLIIPFGPATGQPYLCDSAQRLVSCPLPGDHLSAGGLPKDPEAWARSIGTAFPSLLLGEHQTREIESVSETTDSSGSWESSSVSSGSCSSEDEDAEEGESLFIDEESLLKANNIRRECDNLLIATGEHYTVLEQDRVACLTLESKPCSSPCANKGQEGNFTDSFIKSDKMPHKTSKSSLEGRGHSRHHHKDKSGGHHSAAHASKKQENVHPESQSSGSVLPNNVSSEDAPVTVIETIVITEKVTHHKSHGRRKKKHHQASSTTGKSEVVPLAEVENGATQKTAKDKACNAEASTAHVDSVQKKVTGAKGKIASFEAIFGPKKGLEKDSVLSEPVPKATADKHGVLHKKAYSDVVKAKIPPPKPAPKVVEEIQALPVPEDPQSVCLKCQFGPIATNATVTWTKGGTVLSENKKSAGDGSGESLTLQKACSKDLGMYRCILTCSLGSVHSDFHFTSEAEPAEVMGEEEDVQCAPLLFKEDFLSEQYFGEHQPASISTEREHFGEGMHRKAFRATLKAGTVFDLGPGHPCVLKVHNTIDHGTNSIEELVQRNYNLAVEECHVQNTAREYIKAYNNVAKSAESFGELPEIIPIFLVHRPANNIPYATLEEELRGDFVKYSVRDGKEINLMRRDSEAGQKCCAFQHWVYTITEGNLLVTDMQGVGMKLTDVGIATPKKGYKGFRGNCATSFIDQFKVLHQCNRFCELLGLTSLQPKPKRTAPPAKPKPQPAPKKKTFGPPLKGKS
ncbi:alpha-protein kinase 2 isoform X2 [Engraulis encrasicolus]|uniref:alpha-protein kinase 2 isoform X2 n=1 Tax=Engraulis encrasicolus TaxID=184585 RepID=UPI002FCF0325